MNNDTKNKPDLDPKETGTSTVTTTVEEVETEDFEIGLSPEEEKIIRMRHGRSLEGHEALEFAGGASEETRLKLALMEANLLDAFEASALDPDPQSGVPRSVIADKMDI